MMPKMLMLNGPKVSKTIMGRTVEWTLLNNDGAGYIVSWVEFTPDDLRTMCMAFPAKINKRGKCEITYWRNEAESYNHDAALALNDVMTQLGDKYGYVYGIDPGKRQLFPGEVVADD